MLNLIICRVSSAALIRRVSPSVRSNQIDFLHFITQLQQYLIFCNSPDLNPFHNGFNESFLFRSLLFLLPFIVGGISSPRFALPRGLRADFMALSRATKYMPTVTEYKGNYIVALHLPSCRATGRATRERFATRSLVENNWLEFEHLCTRGYEYFKRFTRLLAGEVRECPQERWTVRPSCVGLRALAIRLMDLVPGDEPLSNRSSHRLSVLVHNLYGDDASFSFWRIARFPDSLYYHFDDEGGVGLLHQSQIQQLLCEGESS
uniref:p0 protein n=1 Tax=Cotton atypical red leaf virus TaxID=1564916 RepID=A0A0F6NWZ7_9VIRU|nr:P0 protein [Cotton atypical red leaf virus]